MTRRWFDLDTILIRVAGLVALLSIPFKHLPRHLEGVVPVQLGTTPHVISFVLGLALLYIASQVSLRKMTAWYVASTSLGLLAVAELFHFHDGLMAGIYMLVLASLLLHRQQYVVRSDVQSLRRGLVVAATMLAAVIVFSGVVFGVIDGRSYGARLTTAQTFSVTTREMLNMDPPGNLPDGVRLRHHDRLLIGLLRLSVVSAGVIVIWSLFRPLRLRLGAPQRHRVVAERILRQYGNGSEEFFKLWPADKHYFFYGDSFVAYKPVRGVALVIDGASGQPELLDQLRQHFCDFARRNGWSVVLIHGDAAESDAWRPMLGERLFIGSEAVVDVASFATATFRNKHFRYIANKAAKDGLQFELWQPPLDPDQLGQLRHISDAWLSHGGRREYSFIMGYFDDSYLRGCQVAVLVRNGRAAAYANLIPQYARQDNQGQGAEKPAAWASIDHMRFVPGMSNVAMHFLLRETIMQCHEAGVRHFNLGLVPLSKLDEQLGKNATERILSALKTLSKRYYSSDGLEQFKGKFAPHWQARYIAYQAPPTRLLSIGLALNNATAYRPVPSDWRPWAASIVAAVAGLAYASFPLAWLLNPAYVWHDTISNLGRDGQPYAAVFNSLDIVSALVGLLVLAVALRWRRPAWHTHRHHWLYGLAVISLGAAALAAAITLPARFDEQALTWASILRPAVMFHGLCSFINSAAFVVSAVLWAWPYAKKAAGKGWQAYGTVNWRVWLAALALVLGTVGAAIGALWPPTAATLQRLFVLCYALWLWGVVSDIVFDRSPKKSET